MKKITLIIFYLCLINPLIGQQSSKKLAEELIIFSQAADQHFLEYTLPKIAAYCKEKGIRLMEKNVHEGTPENIVSTPAIIYQNYRGRSIYTSRYAEFSTIKNFIRTSRVVPQSEGKIQAREVLIWQNGRTKIAAKTKITDLKGKHSAKIQQTDFQDQAQKALAKGMNRFVQQQETSLSKTDRVFYLDMHPYQDATGKCYLSLELYSKFSCKTPVFTNLSQPLIGTVDHFEALFEQAGLIFQQEIIHQMTASKIGDAFTPIATNIAVVTWKALDVALPPAPVIDLNLVDIPKTLPTDWVFKSAIDEETPIVQFRFIAPLDRYVGEIRKIDGRLKLTPQQALESGNFVADMQSLTMGMEDFDKNVLGKYIKAYKFPASSFTFSNAVQSPALKIGETTFIKINGLFKLMKKEQPVEVSAQITPIIGVDGDIVLQVSAAFFLNVVDDFGIKGPDGPSPARKMMSFDLNFLMTSAISPN